MTSSHPKPSYVNISCSVNGYSSFSCYNSTARENLHSHQQTPLPTPLPFWNNEKPGIELKTDNSSDYFSSATNEAASIFLQKPHLNSYVDSEKEMSDSICKESATRMESSYRSDPSDVSGTKSLVQQRIERLYGPAALVEGIFLHKAKIARNISSATVYSEEDVASSMYISSLSAESNLTTKISQKVIKKELELPIIKARLKKDEVDQHQVQAQPLHFNGFRNPSIDIKRSSEIQDQQGLSEEKQLQHSNFEEERKGKHFLLIMEEEKTKIQTLISDAEAKLKDVNLSEEAAGKFRATVGKARLLLNQKFEQFRELCNKNIVQTADDPLPTTASDLEGFWDLVLIQVYNIYDMFYDIGILTTNYKEILNAVRAPEAELSVRPKQVMRKGRTNKQVNKKEGSGVVAREEARKKLMEMKRQAKRQLAEHNSKQTVEIFIPDSKD